VGYWARDYGTLFYKKIIKKSSLETDFIKVIMQFLKMSMDQD
jgi:hypothetical protein